MFTNYYLNLISRNLFNISGMCSIPSKYYIGLSSTLPSPNGTNVTEPSVDAGYKRVEIDNDSDFFIADSIDYDNDYTTENTKGTTGKGSVTVTPTKDEEVLSNIIIDGYSEKTTKGELKSLEGLAITITSSGVKTQEVVLPTSITLRGVGTTVDKFKHSGGSFGVEYNNEILTIEGNRYKLKVVDYDNTQDTGTFRIYRENDDSYLMTNNTTYLTNSTYTTSVLSSGELAISIPYSVLNLGDMSTITEVEINDLFLTWCAENPITIIYSLKSPYFEAIEDVEIQNQLQCLALAKAANTVTVTSTNSTADKIMIGVEYKSIRPYVTNSEKIYFPESTKAWEGIKYYTIFDEVGHLLIYGEFAKELSIPIRSILTINPEMLKIQAVNVGGA